MAYNTLKTSSDTITLIKPMISIPPHTIVDNIYLKFVVTLKNTTAAAVSVPASDLLNAVTSIRITSDGNINNLDTTGYGLAIMNAFRQTKSVSPLKRIGSTSVGANTTVNKTFFLKINEGDIIGVLKKSLFLEVLFAEKVTETATTNTFVTISAASVTASLGEGIIEDRQVDLIQKYGESGELTAEPKIYEMTVESIPANTALVPVLSLQYGSLIRRAILMFYGPAATTPEVCPDNIGLIATNPNRQELINVDAATIRELQDDEYFIDDANRPAGVFLMDFANTLAGDGMGLKGWRFGVDDFRIAVKTSTACKMRVIFIEHVVNTGAYDKGYQPILETPLGF